MKRLIMAVAAVCFGTAACGETVNVSDWAALKSNLESGNNVKLAADFFKVDNDDPISLDTSDMNVTLDLNGHEMWVLDGYLVKVADTGTNITFTLKNSGKEGGSVNGGYTYYTDIGTSEPRGEAIACVLVGKGGTFVFESGCIDGFRGLTGTFGSTVVVEGVFKLTGGTIYASKTTGSKGAGVYVKGGTFIMSGGAISCCEMAKSEISSSLGGGVYVDSGATFEMTGGRIVGCIANQGGGVAVAGGGAFNFSSGRITENKAREWGSGVYLLSESTMSFSGGAISNNTTYAQSLMGAGIVSSGKLTMTGGTIAGNTSENMPSPLAIYSNCDVGDAIYGGVVKGAVTCADGAQTLSVYGGVFDCDQTDNLASGKECTQGGDRHFVGNDILIGSGYRLARGTFVFCPTNAEYVAEGVGFVPGVEMTVSDTNYTLTPTETIDCDTWAQIKSNLEAGYDVKLTQDVAQGADGNQVSLGMSDRSLTMDLNGHSVTLRDQSRLILLGTAVTNATFTLKDSVGTGVIQGGRMESGGCVWVGPDNVFVMNGGTISGCSSSGNGGAVFNRGTFTMNGGAVSGCTAACAGGAFCNEGVLTVNDGMITNCAANGTGPLERGIEGGGAVYNVGTFTLNDGKVFDCSTKCCGGAFFNKSSSVSVMKGGVVSRCSSYYGGGAVYADGSFRIYGGSFFGNWSDQESWSSILAGNNAAVYGAIADNGQIGDKMATGKEWKLVGNVYIVGEEIAWNANSQLTGGIYTFCPTNAQYVSAGLSVNDMVMVVERSTEPRTWLLRDMPILAEPTQIAHTTAAVYTNGFLSTETSSGSGLWYAWSNETATVVYTAGAGYCFAGGAMAATNDLNTTVNPAVNVGTPPDVLTAYEYVDENGELKSRDARPIGASGSRVTWNAGWYVVTNVVTITGGANVNGAVKLILADGAKLTINGVATGKAGVSVSGEGNSFVVYGQVEGTGALEVAGGDNSAGIGGDSNGAGSNITIAGGVVTASGGEYGAGIGGGCRGDGSNVAIVGGIVTATGGQDGAGIGSGRDASVASSNIFVADNVIVRAGQSANPTEVIPHASILTDIASLLAGKQYAMTSLRRQILAEPTQRAHATAAVYTNGFLSAETSSGSGLWYAWSNETATVVYTADEGCRFAGGATVVTNDLNTMVDPAVNVSNPPEVLARVEYMDENGETQTVDAHIIVSDSSRVTWNAGWYVVDADVTITGGAQVSGAVKLILADGAKLTISGVAEARAGVAVGGDGNSFAVYGQEEGTGVLNASGGGSCAGIGGGCYGSGSNITINGGTVTATGGQHGAGIGGGYDGDASNITINGGTVTASGGTLGAGIGGGVRGIGSNITINGGTVIATGGKQFGAGIGGGGYGGSCSNIRINGGIVTASGGEDGAGIGGGSSGTASNIYVADNVIVTAGDSANPTTVILHASPATDVASSLAGKRYAKTRERVVCVSWAKVKANLEAGNDVVLGADVDQGTLQRADINNGQEVTLDLNGFRITGSTTAGDYYRPFSVGPGHLMLTDAKGGGVVDGIGVNHGGGSLIWVRPNGASFTLVGGTITGFASESDGGAVYVNSGSSFTMNGGAITNCSATGAGGAIYSLGTVTVNGGVFVGNSAGTALTALFGGNGTTTVNGGVSDSSLIGEKKASGKTSAQIGSNWIVGQAAASNADGELTGGTYTFCPTNALYVAAGVVLATDVTVTGSGASYTLKSMGVVDVSDWAQVKGNLESGNDVRLVSSLVQGSGGVTIAGKAVTLDLNGFKVTGSSQAGEVYRPFTLSSGACLRLTDSSDARMGAIDGRNVSRGGYGGFVSVGSGSTFTMDGGAISNCVADSYGGAIYCNDGGVSLTGGSISDCSASGGGAIGFSGSSGTVTIENMTLTGNAASNGYGGAINFGNNGGTYVLRNCTITDNSATKSGGALSIGGGCQVRVYDCTVAGNTSGNGYGAVHLNGFTGNASDVYGAVVSGNSPKDFHVEKTDAFTIHGGVYESDPADASNVGIATGYSATQVGDLYVVGTNVTCDTNNKLTSGTYTFCPTNAAYVAAGLSVRESVKIEEQAAEPKTWFLYDRLILAIPTQVSHATAAVYTNGILSAETSPGSGQWYAWLNETATVVYTASEGYRFWGDVAVVTNDLKTTVNPAVNVENPPEAALVRVEYVDEAGEVQSVFACPLVLSGSRVTWSAGWYVVTNDMTIIGGAQVGGAVKLILSDGAKLTITGVGEGAAGIGVTGDGNSFTVYGQVNGTGALDVAGGMYGAGIGGNSGDVGSNITINGGMVTATGGEEYGAGIGGGLWGDASNITVNGGCVTAQGGNEGAGIGGGASGVGSGIAINGGTVTARGGLYGAGIGGGCYGTGGGISIGDACVFVGSPVGMCEGAVDVADLIGNGYGCDESEGSVSIANAARIFFNLTGVYDEDLEEWAEPLAPMPDSFEGFVIMTPATQMVERVLAGGVADWTAGMTFALTNAATGATGTLKVNDPAGTTVAGEHFALPCENGKLFLAAAELLTGVEYVDERGELRTTNAFSVAASGLRVMWNAGWYVVNADVTITGGAQVNGAVNLILADGAKLTICDVTEYEAGIAVSGDGRSFTVYGQSEGTGVLDVTGGEYGAGIGGRDEAIGSDITINGGRITSQGGYKGSGIGGGSEGDGSDITINGGTVTAQGGPCGAGIGGGYKGTGTGISIGNACVFVGSPRARSGTNVRAADLIGNGNGCNESAGLVSIANAARIFFNLTGVYDEDLEEWTEPLASEPDSFEEFVIMTPETQTVERVLVGGVADWTAGTTFALTNAATGATGTLEVGDLAGTDIAGEHFALPYENGKLFLAAAELLTGVEYVDGRGETRTTNALSVAASGSRVMWNAGWYVVNADVTITGGALVNGAVNLILADGAKLTINDVPDYEAGIAVSGDGRSFTIYGQVNGTGELEVTGGEEGAGIGGGNNAVGSNITINGGVVTATGGNYGGAGIGGGDGADGVDITINGGRVIATGESGIGGGFEHSGMRITINGGEVTATGDKYGAGIGGACYGSGSDIAINGGKVTAQGGYNGAGIGGGYERPGRSITISGGVVAATGGTNGAGIGGGYDGAGLNIAISGGTVIATGGEYYGAGIGGGIHGAGSDITINGGTVTATGGQHGAGIGGGGDGGRGSTICVADIVVLRAGNSANPTEVIPHASSATDIASLLAGKRYATTETIAVTYPDYLAKYGAAVTNKFTVWAITFGSCDPDGVYTNAFLLNVATNNQTMAEEAFAIGSIVVSNGVVDVELPKPLAPATSFNGDVWLQCVTNLPAADWKDVESGRYIDEKGSFLRCLIDFEHTLTPGTFPTKPEGTKTIKVFAR